MKSCFMFGHRDCPDSMLPEIEKTIEEYYTTYGVRWFYVGNRGNFDRLGAMAVKKMKKKLRPRLFMLTAFAVMMFINLTAVNFSTIWLLIIAAVANVVIYKVGEMKQTKEAAK